MAGAPAKSQDTILTQTADTVSAVADKVGEVLNVGGGAGKGEKEVDVPESEFEQILFLECSILYQKQVELSTHHPFTIHTLPFPFLVSYCTAFYIIDAIYVDEKSGSDTTGTGSSTSPYLSPLQALISTYPTESSTSTPDSRPIYTLKPSTDSSSSSQWVAISGAAFKKAKKGLETHYKKQKKLEENKEQMEREEREKVEREKVRREEAAGVVLVEPTEGGRAEKVGERRSTARLQR